MSKKKVIRLTESQLRRIVAESTAEILNEGGLGKVFGVAKNIGSGLIKATGAGKRIGEWEKENPNTTKFFSRVFGLTPEADKASERVDQLQKSIRTYVTRTYGNMLISTYIQFANLMTKMVGARNVQDDEDFATYEDDTKYGVPPAFYNNCVNTVNMAFGFLKKWMVKLPENITEINRLNSNNTFVTPQEKAEVAKGFSMEWKHVLNYGFYLFAETVNDCYKTIQREFGNRNDIERKQLVATISEFIQDLKDIKQSMYRIDSYWFGGSNTQNSQTK